MPRFIPGLELARSFSLEAVNPLIDRNFPSLKYAAALIGPGSEVLGFDTEMSTDHCWGPRLQLFLTGDDLAKYSRDIDRALRTQLPPTFRSYPTNCGEPDANDNGTWQLEQAAGSEINHAVQICTLRKYLDDYLGFDIDNEIDTADWLTFPEQKLRTLNSGNVFHDAIGVRSELDRFLWYPNDVWLCLLAAGWNRIGQEEHLMGRAGMVGDEVGSAIIASRLVRDIMRLCFLMEKQHAPYPKWFGTAFSRLKCAEELTPAFADALAARTWQEREKYLSTAYATIARLHDESKITDPIRAEVGDFFGRPFKVIHLHGKFADAIAAQMQDPVLRQLAANSPLGGIDQISDNTDFLESPKYRETIKSFYVGLKKLP